MIQIVLKRTANRQADDFVVEDFAKGSLPSPTERVSVRRDHDEADRSERKGLELFSRIDRIRDDTDVCTALSDGSHDFPARAIFEFNVDIRVRRKERGECVGEQFRDSDGIRKQPHMTSQPLRIVT